MNRSINISGKDVDVSQDRTLAVLAHAVALAHSPVPGEHTIQLKGLKAVVKVEPIAASAKEQVGDYDVSTDPAAILNGFMGWLTCRKAGIAVGAGHDAAVIPPLISAYLKSQGWPESPRDENWHNVIKPGPSEEG